MAGYQEGKRLGIGLSLTHLFQGLHVLIYNSLTVYLLCKLALTMNNNACNRIYLILSFHNNCC